MFTVPDELLNLTKQFEGFRSIAYQDQVGVWTCGFGETENVTANTTMTVSEATTLLQNKLTNLWQQINAKSHVPLTNNELIALCDFAYNLGINALFNSHLWTLLQLNEKQAAADQFPLWCHAGNEIVNGLLIRRNKEKQIFLS